jgi:hypothetical protein
MGIDTSPAFAAKGYFGGVGRSAAGDMSVPFFLEVPNAIMVALALASVKLTNIQDPSQPRRVVNMMDGAG